MVVYFIGSDSPSLAVFWADWAGNLVDFSTGYTFTVKVGATDASSTTFTKTTGIVGAVGDLRAVPQVPNVTVSWDTTGEINSLTAGLYLVQIVANRTSDGRNRYFQCIMEVRSVLT